jgi:general secretion pathway protein H
MPTSAAGSSHRAAAPGALPRARLGLSLSTKLPARGFTLIELLVVVAIIAIGSAGVSFALRDSAANQLDREALRLAALFEAARAQSRSSGQALRWQATEDGFRFEGAAQGGLPQGWLSDEVQVQGTPVIVLGPEPIIGPQQVLLASRLQPDRTVRVATDGLRPFRVGFEAAP